ARRLLVACLLRPDCELRYRRACDRWLSSSHDFPRSRAIAGILKGLRTSPPDPLHLPTLATGAVMPQPHAPSMPLLPPLAVLLVSLTAVAQTGRSMRILEPAVVGQQASFAMQHPVSA